MSRRWRKEHNQQRPHSSLKCLPAVYAESLGVPPPGAALLPPACQGIGISFDSLMARLS